MRVAFVDIQGFMINGLFSPKELAIQIGKQKYIFLFKPPIPFSKLYRQDQKTARYLENYIHGIAYTAGEIEYSEINSVLENFLLQSADIIYVRGHQKFDFLQAKCKELGVDPMLYDVAGYDESPCTTENFQPSIAPCPHHSVGEFRCAQQNVAHLHNWFLNVILPP